MAEPIVGVNRSRITAYSFLGKSAQQQREDSDTSAALRQNQLALLNVNNSLNRITEQVAVLSASLQGIGNQIRETSTLETLKEQQKARQEQILAERQIREGKESQVESKIQAALVTPIQKVGAKAQGTLANLGRFFNILLGGFLLNRILKSTGELTEKGQFSLKNLFDKIVKDLAIVGGIFIGINGGFSTALGTLTRLGSLLGKIAVKNFLMRPFKLIMGLAGGLLTAIGAGIAALPGAAAAVVTPSTAAAATPAVVSGAATAANAGANATRAGAPTARPSRSGPMIRGRVAGPLAAILNFFMGGSAGESLTAGGLALLPSLLRLGGLPGLLASVGLPFLAPQAYNLIQPTVEKFIPQLGMTRDTLFQSLTQSAKNNTPNVSVVNVDGGTKGQQQDIPAAVGEATYLPPVASSNPDNFYLMYSQIQYNVVG
jgi:hypothetical protein